MTMTILLGRERAGDFVLHIHLDSTKLDAEGKPDPQWVRTFTFGIEPPTGRTRAQYLIDIRREVKALCQGELAKLTAAPDAGTVLAIEGLEL